MIAYCNEFNICTTCFLNDLETQKDLEIGFCPICDDDLIKGIDEIKNMSTDEINNCLYEIYNEIESAPYDLIPHINQWIKIYVRELTNRKTQNCEGCKSEALNQQGHMSPGGCLYQEDSVPSVDRTADTE